MQNTTPPSCCCGRHPAPNGNDRRGFLGYTAGIIGGALALFIPTLAGVAAFLNPLRQKSQSGQFMRLASLDVLPDDGTPRKVPVIADRTDAWNKYPAEPIGAVFLSRNGETVSAFQVICPHAGCSIGYEGSAKKYFCPCHAASFDLEGKRMDATSPSPRDMDSLEVEIRNKNEVWVKFQTFGLGTAAKVAQG